MGKNPTTKKLMDNKYWAIGYKWCNNVHIFINIIILIIGALLIYKYVDHEIKYTTADATIKSIENDKCKETKELVRGKYKDHYENRYECIVNVDYKDENGTQKTNNVTTDDMNHKVGDKIQIDYKKNDPNKIYFRKPWFTYLFIAGLFFYVFTIIGTVIRTYYKDEDWAQFFISIGCLQDLFGR